MRNDGWEISLRSYGDFRKIFSMSAFSTPVDPFCIIFGLKKHVTIKEITAMTERMLVPTQLNNGYN